MTVPQDISPPSPMMLVHGAFHGGWCWRDVARRIRAAGHDVFTPTQTGLGERRHLLSPDISMETFVLDIANIMLAENLHDVVLVGHSFGGRSVCGVVDRMPERIRRLILIDAGLPLGGVSRLDAMPEEARRQRIAASRAYDGGISVPPPRATRFDMTDPEQIAWVERSLTPQPIGPERTPLMLNHPIGNGRPVTFVHCIAPAFAVTAANAAYARSQPGWRFIEFAGGHNAIVTHPAEIAELLLDEARLPV